MSTFDNEKQYKACNTQNVNLTVEDGPSVLNHVQQ